MLIVKLTVLTKSEIISRFALNGFKADMKRLELTIENCILTPEVASWGGRNSFIVNKLI